MAPTSDQLLFCLAGAGGAANIYFGWGRPLAPRLEVRPVSLPGRDKLFNEPLARDCATLIARIAPDVAAQIDRPYVVFGHSMGGLVGYELACALRDAGRGEPACLIVSGYPAPMLPLRRPPVHHEPDGTLIETVRMFGGVPEDVLQNREYLDYMLPLLRADLAVLETYEFRSRPRLTCPVIAIGGHDDGVCFADDLLRWAEVTTGPFARHMFPGGHFHAFETREPVLELLRTALPETRVIK